MLDTARCDATLCTLASRITAKPDGPFGMPGVALFACDVTGQHVERFTGTDSKGQPLTADRKVCLASVGKLAVALLVLELIDRNRLALSTTLVAVCPEVTGSVGQATIGDLLSHRAGAPPILREGDLPYEASLSWPQIRAACLASSVDTPTASSSASPAATRVRYSDVAYGLLAVLVERLTGSSLQTCLETHLNARLGTRLSLGLPLRPDYVRVVGVPTPHRGTPIEPLNSDFWHRLALPWAAICGAPRDGLTLLREFTSAGSIVSASVRATATRDADGGALPGGIDAGPHGQFGIDAVPALEWDRCPWGLGVELRGNKYPHWTPAEAGADSFGHVGISGTLVWHDPLAGVSWGMVGTRSSHSGWLLRYGPMLGRAVLSSTVPTSRPAAPESAR